MSWRQPAWELLPAQNTRHPHAPQPQTSDTDRLTSDTNRLKSSGALPFEAGLQTFDLILNLSGSICALATPFVGDIGEGVERAVDFDAFAALVDSQISGGTTALVVAGSTGEAASLDGDEFDRLVAIAVRRAAGRIPVLAGTGASSTRQTVAQTQRALVAGADVALVACPAYVRPTQEGLYRHFSEVAQRGGLPIVLYNVPSRTACDLAVETTARLCRDDSIIGIKEAFADPGRMEQLLQLRDDGFCILSGDDPTCVRAMLAGADGVISVAANVVPVRMAKLADLARSGKGESARAADAQLADLYGLLGIESNPIPLKWCLAQMGMGSDAPRLPLLPLSSTHRPRGLAILTQLGLVPAA